MLAKQWVPWCAALAVMLSACASGQGDDNRQASTSAPSATSSSTASTTEPATTSMVPIGTTVPITTTSTTLAPIAALDSGLFCRDLAALGYRYADAIAYWTREQSPQRMDADRNGIPCETVYAGDDVLAFWGDPLPTTTTSDVWYSAGTPEYHVPAIGGSGGYGSGCSPGPGPLPDGVWFGAIAGRSAEAVQFDLMCFSPGPEGPGDVSNSSTKLRTVPVAAPAFVHAILDGPRGPEWTYEDYPVWLTHPAHPALCGAEGCLVWIYVNDGAVTEVTELFFA